MAKYPNYKATFLEQNKSTKLYIVDTRFGHFFWRALPTRVFSVRIILFGYMELDLPTPVSHHPSRDCACALCSIPTPKISLQVKK